MEFIADNLVWFSVGGIVILMTVVGYMAEKTDFASKKYREKVGQENEKVKIEKPAKKEKEKKKDKKKADIPVVEQDTKNINNVGVADVVNKKSDENSTVKEEGLSAPITENANPVISDVAVSAPNEDLNVPIEDVESTLVVNDNVTSNIEDLAAPISDVVTPNENLNVPTEAVENIPVINNSVVPNNDDLAAPISDVVEPIINPNISETTNVANSIDEVQPSPISSENGTIDITVSNEVPSNSENINIPINTEEESSVVSPIINAPILPQNEASTSSTEVISNDSVTETGAEDLYTPLSDTPNVSEVIEPKLPEMVNEPVVQNENIITNPNGNVEVQEIVPPSIDVINDTPVMANEINVNAENNVFDENTPQTNTEIVNQTSEIFDVSVSDNDNVVQEPEISDFEKIFPEDPIIINDNKNNANAQVAATTEAVASPEDIWKF